LLLAASHFCFFWLLSGSPAEGPEPHLPQTYATTISMLLANGFGLSLKFSLSLAFTQHLWRLVRNTPLKMSTLDALFSLRQAPLALFNSPAIVHKASPLAVMAALIWFMPIVTGFPPGAISVMPLNTTVRIANASVPTFNAPYDGDYTIGDIRAHSLAPSEQMVSSSFESGDAAPSGSYVFGYFLPIDGPSLLLRRLVQKAIITGESIIPPSPRGTNLSYDTAFYGPYLSCQESSRQQVVDSENAWNNLETGYEATLDMFGHGPNLERPASLLDIIDDKVFNNTLTFTIAHDELKDVSVMTAPVTFNTTFRATYVKRILRCTSAKAIYRVQYQYNSYISNFGVSVDEATISPLTGGKGPLRVSSIGEAPVRLQVPPRDHHLFSEIIQQSNLLAPIIHMAERLSGKLNITWETDRKIEPSAQDVSPFRSQPFRTSFQSAGSSLLLFSKLCKACPYQGSTPGQNVDLEINADILNSLLTNITISTLAEVGSWHARADLYEDAWVNSYSLSRPINIILPYSLALFCGLPLIVLGCVSLYRNGVSAIDGGLFQLLVTTRGSKSIDRLAAQGCLGGEDNIPLELKEMVVQYGQLQSKVPLMNGGRVQEAARIVGFGPTDEVLPLPEVGSRQRRKAGLEERQSEAREVSPEI
ncbi:hypothetical protein CP533_6699, partial [Ophiocordyceps camponoti-saundersi (nom. inval.)]